MPNTIIDNKGFLGARWDDVKQFVNDYPYDIVRSASGGVQYHLEVEGKDGNVTDITIHPLDVCIELLKSFDKIIAEKCQEYEIKTVVITTPIRFTELQRRTTAMAGRYLLYIIFHV